VVPLKHAARGEVSMTKSEQMSRVRTRDTEPELRVRRLLSATGVRYRLHRNDLPGTPDIYIASWKSRSSSMDAFGTSSMQTR